MRRLKISGLSRARQLPSGARELPSRALLKGGLLQILPYSLNVQ